MDALAAEIEAEAAGGDISEPEAVLTPEGFVTATMFAETVGKGLVIAGHLSGYRTLAESAARPDWPDAAGAIYDTLRETPALHFLLRPGGKWLQRVAVIGAWAGPVALGCIGEAKARRAAREAAEAAEAPPPAAAEKGGTPEAPDSTSVIRDQPMDPVPAPAT